MKTNIFIPIRVLVDPESRTFPGTLSIKRENSPSRGTHSLTHSFTHSQWQLVHRGERNRKAPPHTYISCSTNINCYKVIHSFTTPYISIYNEIQKLPPIDQQYICWQIYTDARINLLTFLMMSCGSSFTWLP